MSELKMSDVFKLPMIVDGNDVESQPYQHSCMSYEMKSDITCDSSDDARYVAHAINSHDSMVEQLAKQQEEIAEYREIISILISVDKNAVIIPECKTVNELASELLAKHSKGG